LFFGGRACLGHLVYLIAGQTCRTRSLIVDLRAERLTLDESQLDEPANGLRRFGWSSCMCAQESTSSRRSSDSRISVTGLWFVARLSLLLSRMFFCRFQHVFSHNF
jgi:hypothetical protein